MLKSDVYGDVRSDIGTNACHRVRDRAHVPGVIYGRNVTPTSIEVDRKEMDRIIRECGTSVLVDLHIGDHQSTAMIKEIQHDPVTNEMIHIDFQHVSYNERINTVVPIRLKGKERAESSIGVVQQQLRELHISCLPGSIPESIEVDVSMLRPGSPLKVADMEVAGELSILNDPSEVVAALTKAERIISDASEQNLVESISDISAEINKKK